jgi:hypothetical protein
MRVHPISANRRVANKGRLSMRREWDWPPEHGRFKRVEILPPRQPPRIEIHVRRHRPDLAQRIIVAAAIGFVLVMLVRSPMAIVTALALFGPANVATAAFVLVLLLAVVALRERKAGRPF